LAPRAAIGAFFDEIIELSLADDQRKGCLIVNSALELAPHDAEFQAALAAVLRDMEAFFYRCVKAGQDAGAINITLPADDLARMLLGLLMGLRVPRDRGQNRNCCVGLSGPHWRCSMALAHLNDGVANDRPLLLAHAQWPQGHDVSGGGWPRIPHSSCRHQCGRPVQA
jgi:hypothetical protein